MELLCIYYFRLAIQVYAKQIAENGIFATSMASRPIKSPLSKLRFLSSVFLYARILDCLSSETYFIYRQGKPFSSSLTTVIATMYAVLYKAFLHDFRLIQIRHYR